MKVKAHTQYRLADGTHVPGCTTLTGQLNKPALVIWANRLGLQGIDSNKYKDEKAAAGDLTHKMILADLKGETLNMDDWSKNQISLAENSMLSWLEWRERHEIRPILVESVLVSEEYRFGGTPDFVGWIDNIFCLGDYKTGNIYDEAIIQTCGYVLLWEEYRKSWQEVGTVLVDADDLRPIEEIVILGIPRSADENFQERHIRNLKPGIECIKDLSKLYYDLKALKAKS